jgi:hypothetical protein
MKGHAMISVQLSPNMQQLVITDDFGDTLYLGKSDAAELLVELQAKVKYMHDKNEEAQGNG